MLNMMDIDGCFEQSLQLSQPNSKVIEIQKSHEEAQYGGSKIASEKSDQDF